MVCICPELFLIRASCVYITRMEYIKVTCSRLAVYHIDESIYAKASSICTAINGSFDRFQNVFTVPTAFVNGSILRSVDIVKIFVELASVHLLISEKVPAKVTN